MPPTPEETSAEVLIRIQSDVAQALEGLEDVTASFKSMQSASAASAESLKKIAENTERTGPKLTELISTVSNAVTAITGLTGSFGELVETIKNVQSIFSRLQGNIITLDAALNIISRSIHVAKGLFEALKSTAKDNAQEFGAFALSLQNTSRQIGVSLPFYQELGERLQRFGIEVSSVNIALIRFNQAVEGARRGGGLAAIFQTLKIDISRGRELSDIFEDMVTALGHWDNAQQRVLFGTQLFGRGVSAQIPSLLATGEAARKSADELARLGQIFTPEEIEKGAEFARVMSELASAVASAGRQFGVAMLPVIQPFFEAMTTGFQWLTYVLKANREEITAVAHAVVLLSVFATVTGTMYGLANAALFASKAWAFLRVALGGSLITATGLKNVYTGLLGISTGLVAGVTSLVAALRAGTLSWAAVRTAALSARTAFIATNITMAATTLGLSLLIGAIAAAAAEWWFYTDSAEEAAEKQKQLAEETKAFQEGMDEFINRKKYNVFDVGVQESEEQEDRRAAAAAKIMKAKDAEAVAEVERMKGRAAAISMQRDVELKEEEERRRQAEYAYKRTNQVTELPGGEQQAQRDENLAQIAEIEARARTAQETLTQEHYENLRQIEIEETSAIGREKIEKEKAVAEALVATRQMQQLEMIDLEKKFADEELAIATREANDRLALPSAQADLAATEKILAQRAAAIRKHDLDVAKLNEKRRIEEKRVADEDLEISQQVDALHEQAFGTEQTQRLQALASAEVNLVKQLRESGHLQYIDEVREAYAAMREEVVFGAVDIGAAVRNAVSSSIEAIVSGTRDQGDLLKGVLEGFKGAFTQWITQSLTAKLGFDEKLRGNFFDVIPGLARTGAEKVGKIWSNLFSLLGNPSGGGVGPTPSVSEGGASFSGGISAFAGAGATAAGGGYPVLQGTPGQVAGVSRLGAAGFSETEIGSLQGGALAGTGAGAAGAGGAGALGIVGAIVAIAQVVSAVVKAFRDGFKEASKEQYKRGKEALDLSGTAFSKDYAGEIWSGIFGKKIGGNINYGALTGGFGPALEALGVGLFQPKTRGEIVKKEYREQLSALGLPVPREREDNIRAPYYELPASLAQTEEFHRRGLFQDYGGAFHVRPEESLNKQQSHRFARARSKGLSASEAYEQVTGEPYYPLEDAGAPGVTGLRFGPALGLGMIMGGGRAKGQEAFNFANTMTNAFVELGVSEQEARRQMLLVAEAADIDLSRSFEELNRQYLEHQINQTELMAGMTASIDLFQDDLPKSINVAGFVLASFAEKGGVDIALLNERLERAVNFVGSIDFAGALREGLTRGGDIGEVLGTMFRESFISSAFDALANNEAFQAIFSPAVSAMTRGLELLEGGDFEGANALFKEAAEAWQDSSEWASIVIDQLRETMPELANALQAALDAEQLARITDSVRQAIAGGFETAGRGAPEDFLKNFQQSLAGVVQAAMTQGFLEFAANKSAIEAIADDINMATQMFQLGAKGWAGDYLQDALDITTALGERAQEFYDYIKETYPELYALIHPAEEVAASLGIVSSALQSAFETLDQGEDIAGQIARRQRIESLEFAIDRAKKFGEEIKAAELEMELATERAAQAAEGKAGFSAAFAEGLRTNIRQSVMDAIIQAVVDSKVITAALRPFLDVVEAGAKTVKESPESVGDVMAIINAAWADTVTDLASIFGPGGYIEGLSNLDFTGLGAIPGVGTAPAAATGAVPTYAEGGMVSGALGQAQLAFLHGGEFVLPAHMVQLMAEMARKIDVNNLLEATKGGISGAFGGGCTIQVMVQVTGNTILEGFDLEDLGRRVSEASFRGLMRQLPIPHPFG